MIDKQSVETIQHWFDQAKVGGLVLPDGWFGRPYDNFAPLSYLALRPHKLLLEQDDQLLLIFTELGEVRIESSELILTDFAQLVFDWQEYGSLSPRINVYKSGVVKFIPPIGITIDK
jgi:hypothetical protein